MLLHARQGYFIWLVQDHFESAVLDPEKWQWAPDLNLWVYLGGWYDSLLWVVRHAERWYVGLMLDDELLHFDVVCYITIAVYSSWVEACSSHAPSTSCDDDHLCVSRWLLELHIPLYQLDEPILGNVLCLEVLAHVVVPHVPCVHELVVSYLSFECFHPKIWIHRGFPLLIESELKVLRKKEESLLQVLLYLWHDILNLARGVFFIYCDDLYFSQTIDDLGYLHSLRNDILKDAYLVTFFDNHEMLSLLDI